MEYEIWKKLIKLNATNGTYEPIAPCDALVMKVIETCGNIKYIRRKKKKTLKLFRGNSSSIS